MACGTARNGRKTDIAGSMSLGLMTVAERFMMRPLSLTSAQGRYNVSARSRHRPPGTTLLEEHCWKAFAASDWFGRLNPRSHGIVNAVLRRDNGIEAGWLAVDSLEKVFPIDADTRPRRFAAHAPRLAAAAGRDGHLMSRSRGTRRRYSRRKVGT